ncbi:MAG: hypothetical protein V7719_15520 [Psychroserpens sp.]|uniref:hypothetical protein n=1 Tax=Psychroserpens sp. TaxID=2020870 RepID=UPI003001DC98
MRKIALTIICVFSVLTIANAQEWAKYKSTELAFVADFPAIPTSKLQKVQTDAGEIDMNMRMCTPVLDDDNLIYSVIRSDYPEDNFIDATDEFNNSVLDGSVKGAVNNVQGTLVFDKNLSFNGYPSRQIKIDITGGFIYINVYLIVNTMYITQVICEKDKDNNTDIKKFQDSFEIIKVK